MLLQGPLSMMKIWQLTTYMMLYKGPKDTEE